MGRHPIPGFIPTVNTSSEQIACVAEESQSPSTRAPMRAATAANAALSDFSSLLGSSAIGARVTDQGGDGVDPVVAFVLLSPSASSPKTTRSPCWS